MTTRREGLKNNPVGNGINDGLLGQEKLASGQGKNNSVGFIHRNNYFISTKEQTLFPFTHEMKTWSWLSIFIRSFLQTNFSFLQHQIHSASDKNAQKITVQYNPARVSKNVGPQKTKPPSYMCIAILRHSSFQDIDLTKITFKSFSNKIILSRRFPRELHQ